MSYYLLLHIPSGTYVSSYVVTRSISQCYEQIQYGFIEFHPAAKPKKFNSLKDIKQFKRKQKVCCVFNPIEYEPVFRNE